MVVVYFGAVQWSSLLRFAEWDTLVSLASHHHPSLSHNNPVFYADVKFQTWVCFRNNVLSVSKQAAYNSARSECQAVCKLSQLNTSSYHLISAT